MSHWKKPSTHPTESSWLEFAPVALYTALLFVVARFLPLWTKNAAAALTWVVYARLVRWVVGAIAALMLLAMASRWAGLRRRWLFLAVAAAYALVAAWFIRRLGGSVNEYAHFPEYALLALLWHRALHRRQASADELQAEHSARNIVLLSATLAATTGVLEETSQLFIPLRVFDLQDILLNLMGVGLGLLIVWAFHGQRYHTGAKLAGSRNRGGL